MEHAPGRILLAFSGGPDSVGLAYRLRETDPLLGYVDHGLRGRRAAAQEQALVRRAAGALGLRLVSTRVSPRGASEAAARSARYRALHALLKKHGCVALATAHTADDRAETILAALLRGTGLRGLAALRPARTIEGVSRIRPALLERRAVLRARAAAFPVVDDPSNRSTKWSRPRLRHLALQAWAHRLDEDPVPLLCALGDAAEALRTTLESRASALAQKPCRDQLLGECAATFPYLVEALRPEGPPLGRRAYASLHDFLQAGRTDRTHRTPGGEHWQIGRDGTIHVISSDS